MNKKIPIRIIAVLSFAVAASMGISFLAPTLPPQHQAYAFNFNNQQFQSSLTIPGSNADDDEPTTTLTFHDKDIVTSIFKTI
jgi:hypothetical protein